MRLLRPTEVVVTAREIGKNWPTFPKLSDAERDEVHELLDKFADEHEAKQLAYLEKLERTARALGRKVARGELLLADAEQRLERLAFQQDPDCPQPLTVVRYDLAREVAIQAFDAGVRAERGAKPC
jgi:hypothetical protein